MLIEENRYLPFSGRRYIVSHYGEITGPDGCLVPEHQNDGQRTIELEWLFGKRAYSVALLVIVTFSNISLPEHLWDQIEPLYKDNNPANCTPGNLTYRFIDGPIPVEGLDGFYYIPFYELYGCDVNGRVINVNTKNILTWWVTKPQLRRNSTGGYRSARVVRTNANSTMLFRHKALCLTFKPYGSNVGRMFVNHIDGNPSNDHLDNLEWITPSGNIEHAYSAGLRPNSARPVLVKWLENGNIKRFPTVEACARFLGKTNGFYINYRLRNSSGKVFADMLQFKYDDGSEWPTVDASKICRYGSGGEYEARNVYTGNVVQFTGFAAGEKITGVKEGTIRRHVNDDEVLPVNGFNFRACGTTAPWPQHSERHLRVYRDYPIKSPNGVIARNVTDSSELFFTSVENTAKHFAVDKRQVLELMNNDDEINGYRMLRFNLRETLVQLGSNA